jgi:hypothetical protein
MTPWPAVEIVKSFSPASSLKTAAVSRSRDSVKGRNFIVPR